MSEAAIQRDCRIESIFRWRDEWQALVFYGYETETVDSELWHELSARLVRQNICSRPVAEESLRHLLGTTLTSEIVRRLCWRLAGNRDRLNRGEPVRPWLPPGVEEWVPVSVRELRPAIRRDGTPGYRVFLRAAAGDCCLVDTSEIWSNPLAGVLAQEAGFSRRRYGRLGRYPLLNLLELAGVWLYGLTNPERSERERRLSFSQYRGLPSLVKINRRLIWARQPANRECPQNYDHECLHCSHGSESCPMAIHLKDYVRKFCPNCNRVGWVDPAWSDQECLECCRRAVYNRPSTR